MACCFITMLASGIDKHFFLLMIDFQTEVKTIILYIFYSKINDDYFCFDHSVVFRKQLKIYLIKNEKLHPLEFYITFSRSIIFLEVHEGTIEHVPLCKSAN